MFILAACTTTDEPSKAKELAEQLKQQTTETPVVETTTETATEPAQATQETIIESTEQTTTPPETTTIPSETEIMEETTTPAQQRTKMYRFLDTFAQKVKSYEFKYKQNTYKIKGTTYKIELYTAKTANNIQFGEIQKNLFYYDTIYVDRIQKTAIAYCEGHKSQVNTQCTQLELFDLAYPVPFKEYDILLPEDWLLENLNNEPDIMEENKYYIEGRATVYVKFNERELELNFDPGTGLVLRADQKKGSQLLSRYDYEKLVANLVRDIDVKHRSKNEIPSSETFYT